MEQIVTGMVVGAWARLFTGPLSEPEMVFAPLKGFVYRRFPTWIYLPTVGCAKCSAFWWALGLGLWRGQVHFEIIAAAVFAAYLLEKHNV